MDRDGEDIVAFVENMLGAVAVMHIPIQNDKSLGEAARFRRFNGNGDIGEQAEPVGKVRQAMMAGRA